MCNPEDNSATFFFKHWKQSVKAVNHVQSRVLVRTRFILPGVWRLSNYVGQHPLVRVLALSKPSGWRHKRWARQRKPNMEGPGLNQLALQWPVQSVRPDPLPGDKHQSLLGPGAPDPNPSPRPCLHTRAWLPAHDSLAKAPNPNHGSKPSCLAGGGEDFQTHEGLMDSPTGRRYLKSTVPDGNVGPLEHRA